MFTLGSLVGQTLTLLSVAYVLKSSWCFKFGAPASSCMDGLPHHGHHDKLVGPSPYVVWADTATYRPAQLVTITISSAAHHTFRGVVVRAHVVGQRLRLLGEFRDPPPGTKLHSWYAEEVGKKSCLVHSSSMEKETISITWKAPSDSYGDIKISIDLVEDFEHTWGDHYVILKAEEEKNASSTFPYQVMEVKSRLDQAMHWSECGRERGCFLYPDWCSGSDCEFGVTYRPVQGGTFLEFEVMGGTDDYVAIGFSDDKYMGGTDSGFACIVNKFGEADFLHGLMPAYYFLPHVAVDYRNIVVQRINSRIFCRFTRPVNVTVPYQLGKGHTGSDLYRDYYISIAFGEVYKGSTSVRSHRVLPLISKQKTNVLRPEVVRLAGLTPRIKAHGVLNSLAWLGMIGIGSIIPLHYKTTVKRKMSGLPLWFQVHRGLQLLGGCFSILGIIIIFTIGWTKKAPVHAIVGLVTLGLYLLQVVVALCRPDGGSPRRTIFNVAHRLMAIASLILSVVTIFLGVMVDIVPRSVTDRCFTAIWFILATYLIWYFAALWIKSKTQNNKELEKMGEKSRWPMVEKGVFVFGTAGVSITTFVLCIFIIMA